MHPSPEKAIVEGEEAQKLACFAQNFRRGIYRLPLDLYNKRVGTLWLVEVGIVDDLALRSKWRHRETTMLREHQTTPPLTNLWNLTSNFNHEKLLGESSIPCRLQLYKS